MARGIAAGLLVAPTPVLGLHTWMALGLAAAPSDKTDLALDATLLDASFSTGKRTLRYEAMILLDEAEKQVRVYEKTTET
ncbi:hypothetical protein HGA89_05650, partial [bacterium]|nr:hypothetical protein [bacterium]